MKITEAIILGIIQGLTEFLPVSSSGHLVLAQRILHIRGPALFFDTLLHCGTLLAVFAALRRDIWNLLRHPFQRLTLLLIAATAVTVGIALAFKKSIEAIFDSGRWLGPAFLFTAAALFIAEYLSRRPGNPRNDAEMGWFDAVLIGGLQGIALVPGISRSGLTLSGALSRRLERELAARFSFLLSIPAILGALALQVKELIEISGYESINPDRVERLPGVLNAPAVAAGTAAAALVGFASVMLMLKIVKEKSLTVFGVYTALLGLLVILDQNIFHIAF